MHNITYTYDPVGNITRISNAAGGADGLGGSFTYNYSYDDLYRLSSRDGSGAIDAAYTLAMEYSPSGNILKKTLAASKELLGNATMESYENEYSYGGAHTLAGVNDLLGGAPPLTYNFDGSGNMVMQQLYNPSNGQVNERYLCWDEENRLSATRDNNYVTANIYDASGNRSWTLRRGSAQALAGEMNWMWQNGSGFQGYGDLNLRTWYQSELMTITDVGFTKHYFIAGQRIASKLGESLSNADVQPLRENHVEPLTENYKVLNQGAAERMQRDFECLGLDYRNFTPGEPVIRVLDELVGVGNANESNIIFYHSDHLGSSSFLTDGGGVATQHLQYMPFGEDLVHQQNTAAYYTPYTFSGKERDMETGLSYFGARYYDAGLSIWLSVDPMSDEFPSWSPYNYTLNNPINLIDPDGRAAIKAQNNPIPSVIPVNKFVGWQDQGHQFYDRFHSRNNKAPECLDYAKEQMRVVGATAGGAKTSSNMYTYDEKNGVNKSVAEKAVNYMTQAIDEGKPVLVGVDMKSGSPNGDKTTDHFVVVVGYQTNEDGTVSFRFFDNSSGAPSQGANQNNILTYDPQTGKISGQSQTSYGQAYTEYRISQVRVTESINDQ